VLLTVEQLIGILLKFAFQFFFFASLTYPIYYRIEPDVVRLGTQKLSYPDPDTDDYIIDEILTPPAPQNYKFTLRYNDILLVHVDRVIE
jgi:hypothetical protein